MTCREFQTHWDELLDADARAAAIGAGTRLGRSDTSSTPAMDDGEEALLAHAASCPECRPLATRYRVLRHAIHAWRQSPPLAVELADRILAAKPTSESLQWRGLVDRERQRIRRDVLLLVSAMAASIIALVFLNRFMTKDPRHGGQPAGPTSIVAGAPEPEVHPISVADRAPRGRHALDQALVDATSATWDLARSASEPAARISRDVLDATARSEGVSPDRTGDRQRVAGDRPDGELAGLSVPVPSLGHLTPNSSAASAMLQQVGDHLSAGVRPLSDTAWHAFGFLIGPARDQAGPRNSPSSAKGA